MKPRVLVISNNPFSSQSNNGKTYLSLFDSWPKDSIAQIYFNNEEPLKEITKHYFNFNKLNDETDFREKSTINSKISIKKNIINLLKNSQLVSFIYNFYWSNKINNNNTVYTFIEEFKPDIIFFVGGKRSYSYKFVNHLKEKYNLPLYLYYTDDYFVPEKKFNVFMIINNLLFKKEAIKTISNTECLFVISEKMKKEYEKKFNKKCIPIMNSIDLSEYDVEKIKSSDKYLSIGYYGGLHLKRFDTIIKFARVIENYNEQNNTFHKVYIYSSSLVNKKMKKIIDEIKCLSYEGCVSSNEIIDSMNNKNTLLFVESFNRNMINRTRLSLSTKIPEYLAIGKPIIAIGPKESGSIEYISKLNSSFTITKNNDKAIEKMFNKFLSYPDIFTDAYFEGKEQVKKNHTKIITQQKILNEFRITNEKN
ncbi:glycosyltransferase family 1 protein [Macrococcoides caseolyticum]|uniref:glycosyltransferase family 1 protein n=1 Tax=Macrococcoides caseolyticum TaxID=69966 RepID=UPI000C334296|nr:glycosyltransferase family 1 protein [Macrococcus caseolyticus]PKE18226.1 hypothetical protein CW718_00620 [Macrococcus caseolyticus]PKE67595.1 hypothetical protein CW663_07370 [Macrococcus caseolyticus]